jgi:hypothetical protein
MDPCQLCLQPADDTAAKSSVFRPSNCGRTSARFWPFVKTSEHAGLCEPRQVLSINNPEPSQMIGRALVSFLGMPAYGHALIFRVSVAQCLN